jgi:bifunctional NMN adenylyltransferase/nudix hydrolase
MKQFNYCVFIGRFSIFHKGHQAILKQAFSIAEKVIVVIGSAGSARTVRNPWTLSERSEMITESLSVEDQSNLTIIGMKDYTYNDNMWVSVIQEKINQATNYDGKVALIGYESDETSFYLHLFPQFTYIEHGTEYSFHATDIRDLYFSNNLSYKNMVPDNIFSFLEKFREADCYPALKQEKDYIDKYKKSWENAPFPPIFVTVDNLILKSGHLLLIKRGHNPGKGLFALPGGFVNPKEKLIDAALRELKEETKIKVNIPELKKSITDYKVFDDPMRSSRGRVISHTYLINLGSGQLPLIKAGDDAAGAMWIPLSDYYTMEDKFFEDHFHIIRNMISKF